VSITSLSAVELARRIRARDLSAAEVVRAHLEAIDRHNPQINAICTLAAEQAIDAAQRIDLALARGDEPGPLAGLPVGIKDITPTAGIRTTWGSPLFADHIPAEDAEIVARLKAAGAIVIGKTNTPEFAAGANPVNRVFGATRNPWDLSRSAAGSTGGGAAALAARMIPLAQGTDFGGSLRVPAAFCGVVGLRTTAGLVSNHPAALPWHDQMVEGPMARNVPDCALLLDAMIGASPNSPLACAPPWKRSFAQAPDLKNVRLAYAPDPGGIGVDAEVERICRRAARDLASCGAAVEEIDIDWSDACEAYLVLRGEFMVASQWERLDKLDQLGANLANNIRDGLRVTVQDIARAERKRAELWRRFCALFTRCDLLLTPTAAVPPFAVERNYPDEINGRKLQRYMDWLAPTFLVSLATLPAASVPAGLTASGLPVGLQIVGPRFSEPQILSAAGFVERLHPIGLPAVLSAAGSRA
jgi:amidase